METEKNNEKEQSASAVNAIVIRLPHTARKIKIGTDLMTKGLLYTAGFGHNSHRAFESFGDARNYIPSKIIKIRKVEDAVEVECV